MHDVKAAQSDLASGLEWFARAEAAGPLSDAVRKAAAELYLLRGSIHIFDHALRPALKDFDRAVKLVPAMIQRVKDFQDSITVSKSHRYIYIDRNEIVYVAVVCVGVYIAFVLLS